LLLAAAGLKAHQLATEPVVGSSLLDSRWFLIAVVEFELLFAFWLLSGLFPVLTWRATVGLFALFALVSLHKSVSGEASCGCFGTAEVNPWYTFTLDVLIMAALLGCRPKRRRGTSRPIDRRTIRYRLTAVLGVWLVVGLNVGAGMTSYQSTTVNEAGELLGDGRTVALQPTDWIGNRFPLLNWIEIDAALHRGRWLVVLHRAGCHVCEEVLSEYQSRLVTSGAESIAFVQVPEAGLQGGFELPEGELFVAGVLSHRFEWFVETPTQIVLEYGTVQSVVSGRRIADSGRKNRH